jgi:hypothetical protein
MFTVCLGETGRYMNCFMHLKLRDKIWFYQYSSDVLLPKMRNFLINCIALYVFLYDMSDTCNPRPPFFRLSGLPLEMLRFIYLYRTTKNTRECPYRGLLCRIRTHGPSVVDLDDNAHARPRNHWGQHLTINC